MTYMRPENRETPPPSPQLSDVMSLPDAASDVANLSDVSGLSEDEDKHTSDISDSDFGGPDDDEDFTTISRSMVESTFVDVAGDLPALSSDEASPITAESLDANKEKKGSSDRSQVHTPSASTSLTQSYIRKAAPLVPTAVELCYPDPSSDGSSPFRSTASLEGSVASDRTVAATASSHIAEGSSTSYSEWELSDSTAIESDKSALTACISSTDTEVLVEAPHEGNKLKESTELTPSPEQSVTKEAAPPDARKCSAPLIRRALLWHPGILACSIATIAAALGVYQGQINIFPAKAAFAIARTDVIVHPNSFINGSGSLGATQPSFVGVPSHSSSDQELTAAAIPISPVSTSSVKSRATNEDHSPVTRAATTPSLSSTTDQIGSAIITVPDVTGKSDTSPHSRRITAKASCRAGMAPVARPSYADAIRALSLYNAPISSLSLTKYVPSHALQAFKPNIFNKTERTKQKRRARQIRHRITKRARQSYSVLKGDIPASDPGRSVRSRRSRKQEQVKKEEIVSGTANPESVQADSASQTSSKETSCHCKCSGSQSKSQPIDPDSDELFLSPIRTPKRVLESLDYLTFIKWIEGVIHTHFTNMASYLSIDPTSKQFQNLKGELRRSLRPTASFDSYSTTVPAYAKQAVQRELRAWKKEAHVAVKRIKQGSRKSASKARRNARGIVKRLYRN